MPAPHTAASDERVLTTSETAALLGVAVSTAQLWIESGALPAWKTPGGHRRVKLSSVLRLLALRDGTGSGEARDGLAAPPGPEFLPASGPAYPVPPEEPARLLALRALNLVDTPAENVFDRVTWLATQATDCPMGMITLLTSRRQWFKSRVGVDLAETPREWAFCSHAILQGEPFMVEDAASDARFAANPLVTGAPHIRFYGGVPLLDRAGLRVGALCVLDREPRKLREREVRALRELAAIACDEMGRRG